MIYHNKFAILYCLCVILPGCSDYVPDAQNPQKLSSLIGKTIDEAVSLLGVPDDKIQVGSRLFLSYRVSSPPYIPYSLKVCRINGTNGSNRPADVYCNTRNLVPIICDNETILNTDGNTVISYKFVEHGCK